MSSESAEPLPLGEAGTDAAEYAYTAVRDAIVRGVLAPGDEISQVQLAKQLGVSRTPLREALRMLQREGLVDAQQHRQVRIASISAPDVEALYVTRVTLEAIAIQISVPLMSSQELATAHGLLAQMAHFTTQGEYELWEETHRLFHLGLIAHGGPRIAEILKQLGAHAERYRRVVATQEPRAWAMGQGEHQAIVAACVDRDALRAKALLAEHLGRTGFTVVSLLDPAYEPVALRTALSAATGAVNAAPDAA